MARVHAAFVGCKVSQADSQAALQALRAAGHQPVADPATADLHVVMTCAVTAEAEKKSRQLVRRLAAGGTPVVVAGCAAVLRGAQFPEVEVAAADGARGALEAAVRRAVELLGDGEEATDRPAAARPRDVVASVRARFTLKVQDGCPCACSYCTVRLARGVPWSLPLTAAAADAAAAVSAGQREIVLSGINLGRYAGVPPRDGGDRPPAGDRRSADDRAGDLATLVQTIAATPGLARLRLSSLEPLDLTPRLLAALSHPRVARHLHLPLQSADDHVLAAMARPYTFAAFRERLEALRAALPDVAVTTDVIVGFPVEDEDAFARTLAAMTPPGGLFGRAHVFRYSARPGTPAFARGSLPPAVVRARMGRALGAARGAQRAAADAWLGRPAQVLVEEYRDGYWRGYSSQYVRYRLRGEAAPGALVTAVADGRTDDGLKGRIT